MFYQLNLLTILLAPVIAYLAAALIFSLIENKDEGQNLSISASNLHYRDGHN